MVSKSTKGGVVFVVGILVAWALINSGRMDVLLALTSAEVGHLYYLRHASSETTSD